MSIVLYYILLSWSEEHPKFFFLLIKCPLFRSCLWTKVDFWQQLLKSTQKVSNLLAPFILINRFCIICPIYDALTYIFIRVAIVGQNVAFYCKNTFYRAISWAYLFLLETSETEPELGLGLEMIFTKCIKMV